MENNNKLCPLAKDTCIEEKCGWFEEEMSTCSVKLIARALNDQNED